MPSFSEISGELDKALTLVVEKKKKFDDATASVTKASDDYSIAIEHAQSLRDQLTSELNKSLPLNQPNRVRISA